MSYTQEEEIFLENAVVDLFSKIFSNKNIEDTPKVSFSQMLEKPQKGDIISSYLKKSSFPSTFRFLSSRILGLAQGGKFTSLKAFRDKDTIIGYGTHVEKKSFDRPIYVEMNSFKSYLLKAEGVILMRPKNISKLQIDKFIEFMDSRLGESYGYKEVTKSFFDRIIESVKKFITNDKTKATAITKKFIDTFKNHLFCSSIIASAYSFAKFNTNLGIKDILTWPVDFINSDRFEKVCLYRK